MKDQIVFKNELDWVSIIKSINDLKLVVKELKNRIQSEYSSFYRDNSIEWKDNQKPSMELFPKPSYEAIDEVDESEISQIEINKNNRCNNDHKD